MGYFIGHLHPALVHLPIGFIILAVLSEFFRTEKAKPISSFLWTASAIVSILAMITGVVALRSGYYEGANMFIHLLCGYSIAIITSLTAYTQVKNKQWFSKQHTVFKTVLIALLFIGGHNGGQLTHGVEHLPLPFSKNEVLDFTSLNAMDSIDVYAHLIQPIFDHKCNRCHEPDDARGKLDMTSEAGLLDSTSGDPGIVPGNLKESDIFKRVTLNPAHRKFMPPSGPELSYGEIKVLEWWIANGASFSSNLRRQQLSNADKQFFESEFGIELN